MSDIKFRSKAEAHRHFAIKFNGATWELLENPERTRDEDDLMVLSAHASLRHWLEAGTAVHQQRGEWLIARVYAALGLGDAALRHAERCLALTGQHAGEMEDFDRAYAYEAVARAHAIAGNGDEARRYIALAEEAGAAIRDEQSHAIFDVDFKGGDWGGVR